MKLEFHWDDIFVPYLWNSCSITMKLLLHTYETEIIAIR